MPIRVLCSATFWRPVPKFLVLAALVCESWAAHPLEQWEPILTSPQTGFVGIAAGKGPSGRSIVVVAEGTGKLIAWPQDEPANRSTFTTTNRLRAITYGNGRFVAVGLDGPIVTSTNGYDWESALVSAELLTDVYFGNGIFLARRMSGLMRSTNGVDWTVEPQPALASVHASLHFARDYFVMSWMGTNFLSTDGLNWTQASSGTTRNLYTVGYGRGTFVAVDMHNELLTSRDAVTWERRGQLDLLRPSNVAVGNGYLVMVGGGARAYSKNGRNWTVVPSGETEGSVVYANGQFISCGYEHVHQSPELVDVEISSARSLVVNGVPNKRYQIEATVNLQEAGKTEWDLRHVFTLGDGEYEWYDTSASEVGALFYRVSEQSGVE